MKCPKCQAENSETQKFCGECAAPLTSSEDLSVTKTLETPAGGLSIGSSFAGRYDVLEDLGKGGMGEVYKVRDQELDEYVALKLLRPEIAMDEKTIERFRNEIKLARKITHKNVCRMHHLGKEGPIYFITMEYVEGEDLKSITQRIGKLGPGQAVSIAMQVCDGLIEAHRLGIIHRDLKPQNIMIDADGTAKIMDFGIARTIEGRGMTAEGFIVGTPDYISPEQVDGKGVDQRADIYALGVILYEMLTSRLPFTGDTAFSVAMKHKGEAPLDPRKFNNQIPENLTGLILRCMEKDRDNRYQTSEELLDHLLEIEKSLPQKERVAPKIMSRLVITKTKRSPLRKLLIPAMVVVVIAALGMIILFKQTRKDIPSEISNKPLLAIPYFFNDTGDEKLDIFEKNCAQWLINDLYSSRLLNVMPMDKLYGALRKLDLLEVSNYASEDIKKIAQEGGANVVVLASLSTIGNTLRIDFSLYEKGQDHEFDLLASDSVSSRDGDMTPGLIDEMTRKIKSNFNFSGTQLAEDIDYAVGDVTTSNPEALKHYIEGVQLEAKYQHDDAIMALEKAIELDPDFAMAYLEMAKSYQNKIQPVKAHEFREKAYALRERLTERERLLVAASLFDTPGAIEAYKRMVELYPDDYEANHQLAFRYMNIEENDLAIQHWEQAIRIDPKRNFRPYWWLINVYGMIGDYDKARYSLERASQNLLIPPHRLPEWYGDIYLVERRYDLAEREYRNVPEDAPNYIDKLNSLGTIHYFRDEFDKAEIIFKECVDAGGDSGFDSLRRLIRLYRTRGQVEKAIELYTTTFRELRIGEDRWDVPEYLSGLAASYLNAGNPEAAFETYQEAIEDIEKIRTEQQGGDVWVFPVNIRLQLHGQTNALIEMGKLEEAENYMIEIEDLTPEDQRMYRRDRRRRNLLEGKLLSAKGEFSRAIEKLEMAVSLCNKESSISWRTDQANYFNALAEAYEKSDEGDKAISAYEKIILLTVGRFNWGEIYAQAYYRLGMIYQQMGLNTKALENLEKFIELWKDCDPQFQPLIEDARKRIGSLSTP